MVPGDLVLNRFVPGSGDEVVKAELGRSGVGEFCIMGIEFRGLGV